MSDDDEMCRGMGIGQAEDRALDAAIADRDRYLALLKRLVEARKPYSNGCGVCNYSLRCGPDTHAPDCAYAAAVAALKDAP